MEHFVACGWFKLDLFLVFLLFIGLGQISLCSRGIHFFLYGVLRNLRICHTVGSLFLGKGSWEQTLLVVLLGVVLIC